MPCHHHAEELRDADTTRHRQASVEVPTSPMSDLQSVCFLRSWLTWGFVGQDVQIGLHRKFSFVDRYPRSEAVCMTRPVSDAASNSHPVAALNGRTNIPLASGEGSGGRDHSLLRLFKPSQISVRSPGSAGADQAPED